MQSVKAMHEEAYAMGRRDAVPQNALYSIKLRQLADLILVEGILSRSPLTNAEHTKGGGKSKVVLAGESIGTPSFAPWHPSTSEC
jgi:hypothetical protein